MRIYSSPAQAFREVERDLHEMGIEVHPQTMQDKVVAEDESYSTKEVRGYGFKISGYRWNHETEAEAVRYLMRDRTDQVLGYIETEFADRIGGKQLNPGRSWKVRGEIWNEFLHEGKFSYTYAERMTPQLNRILQELTEKPDSRQAIINIHSNICPSIVEGEDPVFPSVDLKNTGGRARIPCSMYYQIMIRENKVDLIYTMRSCDLYTHFPVDIMLALRLRSLFSVCLHREEGAFTYFAGSLHAYRKDLNERGIF